MPLNDNFVCVVNIRENRVARLDRDDLEAWHFCYGQTRLRLGSKKQEVLLDATALLGPRLTREELARVSSHPDGDGRPTAEQLTCCALTRFQQMPWSAFLKPKRPPCCRSLIS